MPVTINGNGTITGVSVGGLPDGIVDTDMLAANAVSSAKLASGAGGKILQVVSTTKTDTFSQSSLNDSTYSNDTGLNVTITPSSSSNKIRLSGSVVVSMDVDNDSIGIVLFKDGSVVTGALGDAAGSRTPCMSMGMFASYGNECATLPFDFLHTAGGTSATTYGIRILFFTGGDSSSTVYMNRSQSDDNQVYRPRSISTITAMEVSA